MFDWLKKRNERAPQPASTTSARCSFCRKEQREVRMIVAGPEVTICNECIVLCMSILDEGIADSKLNEGPCFFYIAAIGDRLRSPVEPAHLEALWQAGLALASEDLSSLRQLAALALDAGHYELAAEASRQIEPSARTFEDNSSLVRALYLIGAYEDASSVLGEATPRTASDRARLAFDRVVIRVREDSNLDIVTLERMLETLDDAHAVLGEAYDKELHTARAECLLRIGQPQMACQALRSLGEPDTLDLLQSMLWGDAQLALGERGKALEWFTRAHEKRGTDALREELAARLAKVSSDPYR